MQNAGLLGVFVLVAFIAGMGWLVYRLLHKKELFREYWKELGVAVILILVTGFYVKFDGLFLHGHLDILRHILYVF